MKLSPKTHPVPFNLRLKEAFNTIWHGLIFLLICIVVATAFTVTNGIDGEGIWAVWLLAGVVLLICIWGAVYSRIRGNVQYEAEGITFMFADSDYYVPPDVMIEFVHNAVWSKFEGLTLNPRSLTNGIALITDTGKPHARVRMKDGKIRVKRVFGLTQPGRYSRIWAERILDEHVCGYELKLQCCQSMFPDRSEDLDIAWMQENGII